MPRERYREDRGDESEAEGAESENQRDDEGERQLVGCSEGAVTYEGLEGAERNFQWKEALGW